MALIDFAGAVTVITGGASGIGLATARALHSKGAHVVLADVNRQGLQEAEQQIRQSSIPEAAADVQGIYTDVTDEAAMRALMQQAVDAHGRIDLVITSAGIGRGGSIDTFTSQEMQTMMNINFMGTFNAVKAALPTMRKQQSGHFVFLSSVAGKLAVPLLSGYCASKWAVRGFSGALRAELYGSGIGITTVYPAWVDTPMIHQEADPMAQMNIQALLTPEQVAQEILQAVQEGRSDLTLAPNPDIAFALQLMREDPEKAEILAGKAYQRNLERQRQAEQP
ncbi:MAG TPA: SDR family oxidoreductase [Ktedonobacteraceae bacterium]|nr:SDR family oxidoreductase [Ktedonobacteraceae bacterium]